MMSLVNEIKFEENAVVEQSSALPKESLFQNTKNNVIEDTLKIECRDSAKPLCNELILNDFNYILQLNNKNVCTSIAKKINNKIYQIFDFHSKSESKSNALNIWMHLVNTNEDMNILGKTYINFNRVDTAYIIYCT